MIVDRVKEEEGLGCDNCVILKRKFGEKQEEEGISPSNVN